MRIAAPHWCQAAMLGALLFAAPVWAASIRVPQQYKSVQAAILAARDGDDVVVSPGVYGMRLRNLGTSFNEQNDGLLTTAASGSGDLLYFSTAALPDIWVVRWRYTAATQKWTGPVACWPRPFSTRWSKGGGRIGNAVFIFLSRNGNTLGYIKSNDPDGNSFGEFCAIPGDYTVASPFGTAINVTGTARWLQPYYAWRTDEEGNTTYTLGMLRSDDDGRNWAYGPKMYEGPYCFAEPSGACVGGNRLIVFARNVPPGAMVQCNSADGGLTWSWRFRDDIGWGHTCVPQVAYDNGRFVLAYHKRLEVCHPSNSFVLTYDDAANVWDSKPFPPQQTFVSPASDPGYPALCLTRPGVFYVMYTNFVGRNQGHKYTVGGGIPIPFPSGFSSDSRIDFMGKNIRLRSTLPGDPQTVERTVLDGGGHGPVVTFAAGERRSAIIEGFTIRNGYSENGGGVLCSNGACPIIQRNVIRDNTAHFGGGVAIIDAAPLLQNNLLLRNTAARLPQGDGNGGGIAISGPKRPTVILNTVVRCSAKQTGGGVYIADGQQDIDSCIIALNTGGGIVVGPSARCSISYSDLHGNAGGETIGMPSPIGKWGNICAAPLFAGPWRDDFGLRSTGGRLLPGSSNWVSDTVDSPCIDAGHPSRTHIREPSPNGGRVNMGHSGNTPQASKSALPATGGQAVMVTAAATRSGTVAITVAVQASAIVSAEVESISGRTVASVPEATVGAGTHTLFWDGRSSHGTRVPRGTYLLRVTARSRNGTQAQGLARVVYDR